MGARGRLFPPESSTLLVCDINSMAELSPRKALQKLVESICGLHQIIVADREGAPVINVQSVNSPAEQMIRPQLLTSYQTAIEQTSKLGLGTHDHMICNYGGVQLVLFNMSALNVTLIAAASANTGILIGLKSQLNAVADQLKTALAAVLPKID